MAVKPIPELEPAAHPSGAAPSLLEPTTPLETTTPQIERPAKVAGGVKAVVSSTRYMLRETKLGVGLKVLANINQRDGFDCPSCAWPDPEHRSVVEFCENGARAVLDEATKKRVDPEFFARYTVSELLAQSDQWLNAQGRITHPMLLDPEDDHYRAVSWNDAFALIAEELQALDSPDQAAFYTSGRTSNEAAFLYQLFARHFGTNNLPDCSNMCHESSGRGMSEVIGVGKGTVRLEDFAKADVIVSIGQNPGTNHPRMLSTLREAKLGGATIIAVNPLREAGLLAFQHPQKPADLVSGVSLADLYLQVKIGGDIALLKAIMKLVLEAGAEDRAFIDKHTDGYDAFVADLKQYSLESLIAETGLSEEQVRIAARVISNAKGLIVCWAMGLTQHQHAVGNIQEVVNLLMLRGMLGKPGAGACPVRGHSNVQGDRTMGIVERPPMWAQAMGDRFGFESPAHHGLDVVGTIQGMRDGKVRVFFALGGNFLSATPDTELTAWALRRCRLTAHVSTKLNRAHLVTGRRALILPCLGRTEKDAIGFVSVEDSMSAVHASYGKIEPASDVLLSEPTIVARLARATLGPTSQVDWEKLGQDYDAIRQLISEMIPGFQDFNQRIRDPKGFYLPNNARTLDFKALGGLAKFTRIPVPRIEVGPDQLILMTIRSHDQFNTTVYDLNDRYRGIHGHRHVLLMNGADIQARGLAVGDKVIITSHFRGEKRRAAGFIITEYDIPRGCAAAYFPEANSLVPLDQYADKSRTPASKSVIISVTREGHPSLTPTAPSGIRLSQPGH
ncbi:MAG TPA: FdhF/YdeP family oxidoreductase [Polyangiaceae bacterium]|nr:FdhF/YdeP family oxidoreductase [Polyangiaceae bacterium]